MDAAPFISLISPLIFWLPKKWLRFLALKHTSPQSVFDFIEQTKYNQIIGGPHGLLRGGNKPMFFFHSQFTSHFFIFFPAYLVIEPKKHLSPPHPFARPLFVGGMASP